MNLFLKLGCLETFLNADSNILEDLVGWSHDDDYKFVLVEEFRQQIDISISSTWSAYSCKERI
jgi:hypothetical protein